MYLLIRRYLCIYIERETERERGRERERERERGRETFSCSGPHLTGEGCTGGSGISAADRKGNNLNDLNLNLANTRSGFQTGLEYLFFFLLDRKRKRERE